MERNNLYNQLLEKVQQVGGYVAMAKSFKSKEGFVICVCAIYESADDSSPLKVIDSKFHAYDLEDYLETESIEYLVRTI